MTIRAACDPFCHEWVSNYYGYACTQCGMFVPFGCEFWMPMGDDEEEDYNWMDISPLDEDVEP